MLIVAWSGGAEIFLVFPGLERVRAASSGPSVMGSDSTLNVKHTLSLGFTIFQSISIRSQACGTT